MRALNKIYYFFSINDLIAIVTESILSTRSIGKSLSIISIFSCNSNSQFFLLIIFKISFHI